MRLFPFAELATRDMVSSPDSAISPSGIAALCIVCFLLLPALFTFVHLRMRRARNAAAEDAEEKMLAHSAARRHSYMRPLVLRSRGRAAELDVNTPRRTSLLAALNKGASFGGGGGGGVEATAAKSTRLGKAEPRWSILKVRNPDDADAKEVAAVLDFACKGSASSWSLARLRHSWAPGPTRPARPTRPSLRTPHIPPRGRSLRALFAEKHRFVLPGSPSSPFLGHARTSPFPAISASASAPAELGAVGPATGWRASFTAKARTIAKRSMAPGAKANRVLRASAVHDPAHSPKRQDARDGRHTRRGHTRGGSEFRSKGCMAEKNWFEHDAVALPSYASAEDLSELLETAMSVSMSSPLVVAWK